MSYSTLQAIARSNEEANQSPVSTINDTANNITFVVYAPIQVGNVVGYKIKKVTANTNGNIIQNGFLPESLRTAGANGSGANVNLKTDVANTILLLNDSSISFA